MKNKVIKIKDDGSAWHSSNTDWKGRKNKKSYQDSYGLSWEYGEDVFNVVKNYGLKKTDTLLDLGCGTMRNGIWLIDYLNKEKYYGLDNHYNSLSIGLNQEILDKKLDAKKPQLLASGKFNIDFFNIKFDFILACALFNHLKEKQKELAVLNISNNLKTGGTFVLNHNIPMDKEIMEKTFKLKLHQQEKIDCVFVDYKMQWNVFKKI